MRQVGILAAAGLVALETRVTGLADDHANARLLADRLAEIPGIDIDPARAETNIVILRTRKVVAASLVDRLKAAGILCLAISADQVRMVTHYDVSRDQVLKAAEETRRIAI